MPGCSFNMDHTDAALVHLAQRDVSFAAISRAPCSKIAPFKKRMGWGFNWVSSNGNDFNRDYHVAFTKEELAKGEVDYNFGMNKFPSEEAPESVCLQDQNGEIFHTYSAYARHETTMNTQLLDYVPKGRDEDGLAFTMSWLDFSIATTPAAQPMRICRAGLRAVPHAEYSRRTSSRLMVCHSQDDFGGAGKRFLVVAKPSSLGQVPSFSEG
jgi:hypothetical protein